VTLVYACTGGGQTLRACLELKPDALIFVRQRSGPVYYWYEALSTRYLSADMPNGAAGEAQSAPRPHVDDVVVDDYAEVLWKLRALHAVKNFLGTRIVALGGPAGKYAADAPQKAQERFGMKIIDVSYEDFEPRIRRALADRKVMADAEAWTRRYLALPRTRLNTERQFVVNSFVLYRAFKDVMRENDANAFTIKACMGTIMPMAETTACLTLSLLNDEGLIAFCESDFVIIPPGLLLRHVVNRPVFLHNSTFPHQGLVTCAHCTSPRRLDGRKYEPTRLVTHYESEFGAATKVDMPLGQEVTFINPEYSTTRWLGFKGTVKGNPFYDICRSQQDVAVQGEWRKLLAEVRDSHWVMAYGNWLNELGFAARKVGVKWASLDAAA
jgi:L-fucose isomerase-like protein